MKKSLFCLIIILIALISSSVAETGSETNPDGWEIAPEVSFASQTADGEITLRWDHDKCGTECEYEVNKINKILGVTTGKEALGITGEHEFCIRDLTNGDYCFNIVPVFNSEKGSNSADCVITLKNEWVVAPDLSCEYVPDTNRIKLTWTAPSSIETYHIIVYAGDSGSLLKFVNLDYSLKTEFDVQATAGDMEYIYEFEEFDPFKNYRYKFDIIGMRHTAAGEEQKSAVSSKSIAIKGKKAITMRLDSDDYADKSLDSVMDTFTRFYGFADIETEAVCFDSTDVVSDHVVSVLINGAKFSKGDKFVAEARVTVQYRDICMYDNKKFDRAYYYKSKWKGSHTYKYILIDDDTYSVYEFTDGKRHNEWMSHYHLKKETFPPEEGYIVGKGFSSIDVVKAIDKIRYTDAQYHITID